MEAGGCRDHGEGGRAAHHIVGVHDGAGARRVQLALVEGCGGVVGDDAAIAGGLIALALIPVAPPGIPIVASALGVLVVLRKKAS